MKAPVTQSRRAEARRPARGRREEGVTHPSRKYSFLNESPAALGQHEMLAQREGKRRSIWPHKIDSTFLNESPSAPPAGAKRKEKGVGEKIFQRKYSLLNEGSRRTSRWCAEE